MNRQPNRRRPAGTLYTVVLFLVVFSYAVPCGYAENRIIDVGVYENEPKVFTDDGGKPAGIFIDILDYIAEREDWELHYIHVTWSEGLDRLQQGKIDLMPDVADGYLEKPIDPDTFVSDISGYLSEEGR